MPRVRSRDRVDVIDPKEKVVETQATSGRAHAIPGGDYFSVTRCAMTEPREFAAVLRNVPVRLPSFRKLQLK